MKKLFVFLMLGIFMISMVSAWDKDNVKDSRTTTFDGKSITGNTLLEKYKPIEIRNAFGLPIIGDKIFEGYLSKHDDTCGTDCSSTMEIKIHENRPLVDSVDFYTILEDNSRIKQPVRSYQFYIKTDNKQIDVNDYEYQCVNGEYNSKNDSYAQICNNVLIGSHKEDAPTWTPYGLGTVMPEGTYTVKLDADKKASRSVDWVIKTGGKTLNEWAIWGATSEILTNAMRYFSLDEGSGDAVDKLERENLTEQGTVPNQASGIISSARGAFSNSNYFSKNNVYAMDGTDDFSQSVWIYRTGAISSGEVVLASSDGTTNQFYFVIAFDSNNKIKIEMAKAGSAHVLKIVSDDDIPINTWTHVAFTYDGGNYNGTLFVNGTAKSGTGSDPGASDSSWFQIGAIAGGSGFVNGYIDEVGYWNTTLTPSNISEIYNSHNGLPFTQGIVTLNSPTDDSISNNPEVTFNGTATVTGGATLTNMSLWTNITGSWEIRNTTTFEGTNETSSFNPTTGGISDRAGWAGQKIVAGEEIIISGFSYNAGTPAATKGFLLNSTKGIIDTVDVNGDNTVTFSSPQTLQQDVSYYLAIDRNNATWEFMRQEPITYPQDLGIINLTAGLDPGAGAQTGNDISTLAYSITKIFISEPLEISTSVWNVTISGNTLWNVQACDSDGDCGFSSANFTVGLDATSPAITVEAPNETLDYGAVGNNETLNVTFTDSNLDSCWYNYNGTNTTIPGCLTGVKNSTQFLLEADNTNMTIYANDSVGNLNATFINWSYTYLENNRTLNTTSFETAGETFSINVEGASSATLFYNGTEYTTTKSGNDFTRTLQMTAGQLGNHSVYWRFDDTQNSFTSYQNVSETVFTLCNATYNTPFLNISFKDESDLTVINGSIPTSTFDYYLGDGTVTKTLTYINVSNNFNYEFCATPNRTIKINSLIQYKQGSAYPQRIFSQTGAELTNIATNLTLYLLGVSDGLFVTFQVFGGQSNAIEGVSAKGTRVLEGSDQTVAQGTTDAAGTVTFWLNPDFLHTFTYAKTGFQTVIESLFPTQTLYTVTLGSTTATTVTDTAEGIIITTIPQGSFLDDNTFYNFEYTINSSVLTLEEYGMELFLRNGTSVFSDTDTTSTGGTLSTAFNTSNNTKLVMTYYYITNNTRINGTTYWLISASNDFSITHFFTRIGTYITANIFGIQGDDEGYFAKALLSILVLILVTGTISARYGLASEAAVTGILFGVIFMLNLFNLIPTPDFLTFINLGDFLVFLVALFAVSIILKEERR